MAIPSFDRLFPTMAIGSLPRPRWVVEIVRDRLAGALAAAEADRLLDEAIVGAVRLQERAGLDYVSDGEWRRENYARVFADKVGGFRRAPVQRGPLRLGAFVEKKLERQGPIVAAEAEFLMGVTSRRALVTLPAPSTVGDLMWHPEHSAAAYPTKRSFVEACAGILREEIAELVRLGVDAIQLDEPLLPRLVNPEVYHYDPRAREEVVQLSVETINQVTEGMEPAFITVHLCHGHGEQGDVPEGTGLMQLAMDGMRVDRLALELNSPIGRRLQSLSDFPKNRLLGMGVIVPGDEQVETAELVVARARAALAAVPAERLVLNADCGFATTAGAGELLDRSYLKLQAMCAGAELLRASHLGGKA